MTTAHTLTWLAVVIIAACAGFVAGCIFNAPEGWEDERGFRLGREEDQ